MMWSDDIRWSLTRFSSLAINFKNNMTHKQSYHLKSPIRESSIHSNFDRITTKLGIISICSVALSCYTLPTSSRVSPASFKCRKIRPAGRLLVTFKTVGILGIVFGLKKRNYCKYASRWATINMNKRTSKQANKQANKQAKNLRQLLILEH